MNKRPCWVEISAHSLESNYRKLQAASVVELLAIVKANAYGHGLSICAPAAVRAGAHWLGVTSVEEGVAARAACPEAEILIIGGPFASQGGEVVEHRLAPVVWEHWQLDLLERAELERAAVAVGGSPGFIPVHLELDTGMSRQGAGPAELARLLVRFHPDSPLRLDGLMTHLYAADESNGVATHEQFARLEPMVQRVFAAGLRPKWLHVGNSAAVLADEVPSALDSLCEPYDMKPMARPGLALYGLAPEFAPETPPTAAQLEPALQPVLTWKTQIVSTRSIPAGQVIGYNGTFVASEPMRVALLAVGYADGLNRALSNRGAVLIAGQRAPIVGRISMDQTVVDITDIPTAAAGDEVILLGRQGVEAITANDHAHWAATIPWEIFTSIAARVERIAV